MAPLYFYQPKLLKVFLEELNSTTISHSSNKILMDEYHNFDSYKQVLLLEYLKNNNNIIDIVHYNNIIEYMINNFNCDSIIMAISQKNNATELTDNTRQLLLFKACSEDSIVLAQMMINLGVEINWIHPTHKLSPLAASIIHEKSSVVDLLLGTPGININHRQNSELTPCHIATLSSKNLKTLIDRGADINATFGKDLMTPLMIACTRNITASLEILLKYDHIDIPRTILDFAKTGKIADMLIRVCNTKNINIGQNGWALNTAIDKQKIHIVKSLLLHGANPNMICHSNSSSDSLSTHFHTVTADLKYGKILGLFLKLVPHKLDYFAKNSKNLTPFYFALKNYPDDIWKNMIVHEPKLINSGVNNRTWLHYVNSRSNRLYFINRGTRSCEYENCTKSFVLGDDRCCIVCGAIYCFDCDYYASVGCCDRLFCIYCKPGNIIVKSKTICCKYCHGDKEALLKQSTGIFKQRKNLYFIDCTVCVRNSFNKVTQ